MVANGERERACSDGPHPLPLSLDIPLAPRGESMNRPIESPATVPLSHSDTLRTHMSSLLQLHAGTAGNYRWGSHLTRFSFLSPVDGHTLPRTLAGSIESRASWNSNVELRESLVIMHET